MGPNHAVFCGQGRRGGGDERTLIQQLVQTSAAIQSPTRVQMVRLTISDATGQVLLDYAEDLSTGSVSAYHTSGMGDGWTKHPGRADMKGAELQE